MTKLKLYRIATVPISLNLLLKGQLNFLNNYFDVTAISSGGYLLEEVEKREGVAVFEIEMKREISIFSDLVSLFKLWKLFLLNRPRVVHSITPKAGLLSMIAAKFSGVPVRIHTFTGLIFPTEKGAKRYLLILMDKLLCYCATNIYPEGVGVMNDLKKYGITKKPLTVLGNGNVNGIDIDYFDPNKNSNDIIGDLRNQLGVNCNDFVFIFVGRLVGDKGINELVSAFSLLSLPNIKLLLVGPKEPDLDPLEEKTINEILENKNIIDVGYQDDVRKYFGIANALVFPSYREGFPNVVLQAGAMGLPAIVSDINGCNEIIKDCVNGLIIAKKDVLALKDAMARIAVDNVLYNKLKGHSRELIIEKYDNSIVWNALLLEYKTLCNQIN